jgi:ubiquinone/menaquinone biosynthesis C-methylase UbiE
MKRHVRLPYEWNESGRLTDDEYKRLKLIFVQFIINAGKNLSELAGYTFTTAITTKLNEGIVFQEEIDKITSADNQRREYNSKYNSDGTKNDGSGDFMSYVTIFPRVKERTAELLSSNLNSKDKMIVSIGAGTGELENALMDKGFSNLTAVDISETNVEISKAKGVNAIVADAYKLPFENSSVDSIYVNETIGALSLDKSLKEVARVLKPGGKIFIIAYKGEEINARAALKSQFLYYTLDEMKRGLVNAGFDVGDITPILQSDFPEITQVHFNEILSFIPAVSKKNAAMTNAKESVAYNKSKTDVGGIDLNSDYLKLKTKGDAIEFNVPDELMNFDWSKVDGLVPVIINIVPVTNINLLLGLNEQEIKDLQAASADLNSADQAAELIANKEEGA